MSDIHSFSAEALQSCAKTVNSQKHAQTDDTQWGKFKEFHDVHLFQYTEESKVYICACHSLLLRADDAAARWQ